MLKSKLFITYNIHENVYGFKLKFNALVYTSFSVFYRFMFQKIHVLKSFNTSLIFKGDIQFIEFRF